MEERTPNEIRDEAVTEWNSSAPLKYDIGQKAAGDNLDAKHDLIGEAKKEAIDLWFYLCSAEREKESLLLKIKSLRDDQSGLLYKIKSLSREVERLKEVAKL